MKPDSRAQMIGPSDKFNAVGSLEERAWLMFYRDYAEHFWATPDFITLLKFYLQNVGKEGLTNDKK